MSEKLVLLLITGLLLLELLLTSGGKRYENVVSKDVITKQEYISKRTIYKYLNLAYLSPKLVNQLLDGTINIPLQKLFEMVGKYDI